MERVDRWKVVATNRLQYHSMIVAEEGGIGEVIWSTHRTHNRMSHEAITLDISLDSVFKDPVRD